MFSLNFSDEEQAIFTQKDNKTRTEEVVRELKNVHERMLQIFCVQQLSQPGTTHYEVKFDRTRQYR